MSRRKMIALSMILLVAIASLSAIWYLVTRKSVIERPANVKSIEIVVLESFPVQVNVVARGEFPDSCTGVSDITARREGPGFFVTITASRPSDIVCAQVITPFERTIPLDVVGLKKGYYTVDVNGVRGTFELQTDNMMQDIGFLEGKVEIGPLSPVEPCNLAQDQIAQAYEARKIIIYTSDRSVTVATVSIDPSGNYRVALAAGKYLVDINRIGMDHSNDVPREIVIERGETVSLDIQIDTGIR